MPVVQTPPPTPPPPEVRLADQTGTALAVMWQGVGSSAANYIVQLLDRDSSAVERFVRPATEAVGVLELCIGGLVPNRCYTASVISVSHCGCESAPSCWSAWLTLQTLASIPLHGNVQGPTMQVGQPQLMPQLCQAGELPPPQAEVDLKKLPGCMMASPPEVTGHEDDNMMLVLD